MLSFRHTKQTSKNVADTTFRVIKQLLPFLSYEQNSKSGSRTKEGTSLAMTRHCHISQICYTY